MSGRELFWTAIATALLIALFITLSTSPGMTSWRTLGWQQVASEEFPISPGATGRGTPIRFQKEVLVKVKLSAKYPVAFRFEREEQSPLCAVNSTFATELKCVIPANNEVRPVLADARTNNSSDALLAGAEITLARDSSRMHAITDPNRVHLEVSACSIVCP